MYTPNPIYFRMAIPRSPAVAAPWKQDTRLDTQRAVGYKSRLDPARPAHLPSQQASGLNVEGLLFLRFQTVLKVSSGARCPSIWVQTFGLDPTGDLDMPLDLRFRCKGFSISVPTSARKSRNRAKTADCEQLLRRPTCRILYEIICIHICMFCYLYT